MSRDPSTPELTKEIALDDVEAQHAVSERPRRRLGGWQLGTGELDLDDGEGSATLPLAGETAAFSTADLDEAVTLPLVPARSQPTAGPARATEAIAASTAALSTAATPQTIGAPTVAPAAATAAAATVELVHRLGRASGAANDPTLPIAGATTPIAPLASAAEVATSTIHSVTNVLPAQHAPPATQAITAEALGEIERLRSHVAASPDDAEALFQLSVALHKADMRHEARESLTALVELYERRGQHQKASRIRSMLGAPPAGPVPTGELPARRESGPLPGRTAALRNITTMIGKARDAQRQPGDAQIHAFPPESMLFTIPLPDQEQLPEETRELLRQSDAELNHGRLDAAFDTCLQVIAIAPDYTPIYLRLAEIYTRRKLLRRARAQAEALARLADATRSRADLWMVYRVILHASGGDTASLRQLVELLIESDRTEQASIYAARLIQILTAEGLDQEALSYSVRLCELIPGDTRAALENAILRLKVGDRGGALDRWESAVARGADPTVAKAAIAALTTTINEDDHWRMMAEVIPAARKNRDRAVIDAYARTAALLPESATLVAGRGLLQAALGDEEARPLLMQAAGMRGGASMARASAAVQLAVTVDRTRRVDEYVASVRTALELLRDDPVANHPAWEGLVGRIPRFEDLSMELGTALLSRGDPAGAVDVLKEGHARCRHHGPLCEKLAEAYFKIGQLGSALNVLDELAVHHRSIGQLEAMAGVLRQMSQLAPNNIKVKSRLIDAYLQRGFVAEARAELVQRADLEERSGLIKDAVASLQRAAELSWTLGLADETFSLYSRVIALVPDDPGHRSAVVNYYLQLGRLSEAAEHQRAVVDIALRNNHRHEAIAALHQVIGLTPDDATAYYQLGDLLAAMGEYRQAERVYRRLVTMNPSDPIAQAKVTSMASLRDTAA